ncbi:unnamed protein product [Adineta steineri]|nr:unnamed protein product [Adineta steineri]
MQFSSIRSQQQNLFPTFSTPYSQQTQFPARSPPTTITTDTSTSPIKECYPDNEHSDFYGSNNNATSISSASDTNELDNTDDQRQNDREPNVYLFSNLN